uniref:Uncharacterized protein n=1 Tax=Bionectria ochroleuca TaxID=29856 RepID=A0A8H7N989_BIOOC
MAAALGVSLSPLGCSWSPGIEVISRVGVSDTSSSAAACLLFLFLFFFFLEPVVSSDSSTTGAVAWVGSVEEGSSVASTCLSFWENNGSEIRSWLGVKSSVGSDALLSASVAAAV